MKRDLTSKSPLLSHLETDSDPNINIDITYPLSQQKKIGQPLKQDIAVLHFSVVLMVKYTECLCLFPIGGNKFISTPTHRHYFGEPVKKTCRWSIQSTRGPNMNEKDHPVEVG